MKAAELLENISHKSGNIFPIKVSTYFSVDACMKKLAHSFIPTHCMNFNVNNAWREGLIHAKLNGSQCTLIVAQADL